MIMDSEDRRFFMEERGEETNYYWVGKANSIILMLSFFQKSPRVTIYSRRSCYLTRGYLFEISSTEFAEKWKEFLKTSDFDLVGPCA